VSVVAYEFGKAAGDAIGRYGVYGAVAIVAFAIVAFVAVRFWHRRVIEET
jgi:hypothetical protein